MIIQTELTVADNTGAKESVYKSASGSKKDTHQWEI